MFKKFSVFLLLVCFSISQVSAAFVEKKAASPVPQSSTSEMNADMQKAYIQALVNMDRKSFEQATGKKLSWKESIQLKMAQKMMKKDANKSAGGGSLPKWAYIVLSIIALGWLAIGVKSDWSGNDWWISLLLYFCFVIPGIIYSLIVMGKYY